MMIIIIIIIMITIMTITILIMNADGHGLPNPSRVQGRQRGGRQQSRPPAEGIITRGTY